MDTRNRFLSFEQARLALGDYMIGYYSQVRPRSEGDAINLMMAACAWNMR